MKVIEVAEILGVTRGAIYKKIKKLSPELDKHVFKQNNTTHIDKTGIEIIRKSLEIQDDTKVYTSKAENVENKNVHKDITKIQEEIIEDLRRQVERLEHEVDIKNQQFNNFQVLLKQEQDRSLLLEHQLDEKSETETHKTIWEKLFGISRKTEKKEVD